MFYIADEFLIFVTQFNENLGSTRVFFFFILSTLGISTSAYLHYLTRVYKRIRPSSTE